MEVRKTIIAYLKKRQVCGDQVIIIPDEKDKVLKGGIVTADENKQETRQQKGEIIAMGPGRMPESGDRQPMEFKVGDTVLFKKYAGDDMYFDQELEIHPAHEEPREGLIPVKILRQDSILFSL